MPKSAPAQKKALFLNKKLGNALIKDYETGAGTFESNYITNELLAPDAAQNTIAVLRNEIKSLSYMPERIKLTNEEPWHSEGIL